jgi:hypothetical protein
MKKVVLFVAVLMLAGVVSLSAQAPEPKLDVALSGSASFTFGINFDAVDPADPTKTDGTDKRVLATGIKNDLSNKATLTILAAADYEKGGAEGEEVYGWIKLRQIKIDAETETTNANLGDNDSTAAPDGYLGVTVRNVEAKLFLGPVFVNVQGTSDEINKAGNYLELFHDSTTELATDNAQEYAGIAVGLKDESVVSVVVGLSSRYDYLVGGINIPNNYNSYVAVALKAVPDLTVELAAATGAVAVTDTNTMTIGFGAKVGYAIALAEAIKLNPYVALDYKTVSTTVGTADSTSVSELQFTGGLNLSFPGAMLDEFNQFGKGIDDADGVDINPGLTALITLSSLDNSEVEAADEADADLDLGVYFFDGDLIPVLNVVAALEIADLTAVTTIDGGETSQLGWGVYVEAVLDQLKPFAAFYSKSSTAAGLNYSNTLVDSWVTTAYTRLKVGVDITVITNTTFSIVYTNGGLAKVLADGTSNSDVGTLELTTKISY